MPFVKNHNGRRASRDAVYAKIEKQPNGCWLWTAALNNKGYARVRFAGKEWLVHKLLYEREHGLVPDGFELDHFRCDTRRCVNPEHVKPVTHAENVRCSALVGAIGRAKTHCPAGHAYTPENTIIRKSRGTRECRTCKNLRSRRSA